VLGEEVVHDTGDYMGLLDQVLERAAWPKLRADLAGRRRNGELVGAGIAMYVEKSGLGPSDGVRIAVDTSGRVEVVTGGASVGQGFETVIAQVAAETIGVDYRHVRVIHGQTDRIAFGLGAHASRATVMTASATSVAALKLRDKALDMAAQLTQSAPADLDIIDGMVVRKAGGPSMPLGAIAAALLPASPARQDREPGLGADGWFHTAHQVYPYGSHLAVVKVDPDTGAVAIERYVIGYDVGRAVNPMLVEGQIVGGFAQGLGGALMEDFRYSERGDPLSVTFADYLMPTAREMPGLEIILAEDFPADLNPLGIKGAGESGITAVGAAIANAVEDAIGLPGAITELPITPQRLRGILRRPR
jgi:aerobic carbon-monoxide dehydrogenase large subunit